MARPLRLLLALTVLVLVLAPTSGQAAVKRPGGTYEGDARRVLLSVGGTSVSVAAFDFPCRSTTGRVSLNDIPVRRRRGRWRFSIRMFASATYRDAHPDENVRVRFWGRFSPNGDLAVGGFVVSAKHCGRGKTVAWKAYRSTD